MELGPYSSYRLPAKIRAAFGVDTAQQLVDILGIEGDLTPTVARQAEDAYNAYSRGDAGPARTLLTAHGLSDAEAADVIEKLAAA